MRISLILIFSFLIQNAFFAQQEISLKKVAQSKPITFDKYESFLNKPIITKDGIFYIKGKNKNYMVVRLSEDLKVFRQKKIKLRTKKRKHRFEFLINHNDKLLLFSSYVNKRNNNRILVYHEVNTSTLEVTEASKPIANVGLRVINDAPGTFNFKFSPDKSKIIFYSHKWRNDERKMKISIHVYDSNLNEIWKVDDFLVKKGVGFKMIFGHPVVDNSGNVYFLKRVSKNQGITFNSDKGEYDFSIFNFLENGKIQNSYDINPDGNNLVELHLKITNNQDLIGMGFFNDKNLDCINGIAHIPFDKSGLPLNDQMIFSSATSYNKNISFNKNDPFPTNMIPFYNIKNIIEKASGNLVMIAEDSTPKTYGFSTYGSSGIIYEHGEIIVIENNKDGSSNWIFRIPKNGLEDYNSRGNQSFLFFQNGEKLTFIFNDHPGKFTRRMSIHKKKSHILIAGIDENGNTTRRALFPEEKPIRQRFTIIPSGGISENEIIIFKYNRLLKLKIE